MNFNYLATLFSNYLFLLFVVGIPCYGYFRKIKIYDCFLEGGKDGFQLSLKLMPYFVAMLVAIGMLRASGAFDTIAHFTSPLLQLLGIPEPILPLALMRPFSGSASNSLLVDIIHTYGADSLIAQMAATIIGSTETTFYVIAVYFGVIAISRTRHAIICGLAADGAGVVASVWVCRWLFS